MKVKRVVAHFVQAFESAVATNVVAQHNNTVPTQRKDARFARIAAATALGKIELDTSSVDDNTNRLFLDAARRIRLRESAIHQAPKLSAIVASRHECLVSTPDKNLLDESRFTDPRISNESHVYNHVRSALCPEPIRAIATGRRGSHLRRELRGHDATDGA